MLCTLSSDLGVLWTFYDPLLIKAAQPESLFSLEMIFLYIFNLCQHRKVLNRVTFLMEKRCSELQQRKNQLAQRYDMVNSKANACFSFLSFFFFIVYFTLQYCIRFAIHWHESTTDVHEFPNMNPLPHPTPYHLSGSSPCTSPKYPVSCIEHRLAIHFLHDSIHVSMPFSQIIPPSPSPSESKSPLYTSMSFLLSCIQGRHCQLSKFHIYVLVYCIGVFLSGLLHSV